MNKLQHLPHAGSSTGYCRHQSPAVQRPSKFRAAGYYYRTQLLCSSGRWVREAPAKRLDPVQLQITPPVSSPINKPVKFLTPLAAILTVARLGAGAEVHYLTDAGCSENFLAVRITYWLPTGVEDAPASAACHGDASRVSVPKECSGEDLRRKASSDHPSAEQRRTRDAGA